MAPIPFDLPSISIPTFITNRKRTFSWIAGTIGGAYLLGSWGMSKVGQIAEKSRKEKSERDNLTRRFNLNQSDISFTLLALLPTLSSQLLSPEGHMDVEGASARLANMEARKRVESLRLAAEEEEKLRRALEEKEKETETRESLNPTAVEFVPAKLAVAVNTNGNGSQEGTNGYHVEETAEETAEVERKDDSPPLTNGATPEQAEEQSEGLGKSWAEVVKPNGTHKNGNETSANGGGDASASAVEESSIEVSVSTSSLPLATPTPSPLPPLPVAEPEPTQTRAEIWHEIKILSFARTLTALYVLALLSLQTHVQLNLLGRSAYVSSVVSSLPPPSPTSSTVVELDEDEEEAEEDEEDLRERGMEDLSDAELEKAVYEAQVRKERKGKGKEVDVGVSKETERMYLTFSWWLLHRGWKELGEKVREAVEEVVGPMPLKSNIVYGELSTLLGQMRHKIEHNADGSPFDFSPILFPSTPSTERETLLSGGIPPSKAYVTPSLRRLLNETSDFLDCADCNLVRSLTMDRMIVQLVGGLEGPFRSKSGMGVGGQGSRFEDITEKETRLASLLPTMARMSHLILNGMPNEFVEALEDIRELKEFDAIVYGSFDRMNARGTA